MNPKVPLHTWQDGRAPWRAQGTGECAPQVMVGLPPSQVRFRERPEPLLGGRRSWAWLPTSQVWAGGKSRLLSRPKFTREWLGLESGSGQASKVVPTWLPALLHPALPLAVFFPLSFHTFDGPAGLLQFTTGSATSLPFSIAYLPCIHLNFQPWTRFLPGPCSSKFGLAFPGSLLEMQNPRPRSRHAETESAF